MGVECRRGKERRHTVSDVCFLVSKCGRSNETFEFRRFTGEVLRRDISISASFDSNE